MLHSFDILILHNSNLQPFIQVYLEEKRKSAGQRKTFISDWRKNLEYLKFTRGKEETTDQRKTFISDLRKNLEYLKFTREKEEICWSEENFHIWFKEKPRIDILGFSLNQIWKFSSDQWISSFPLVNFRYSRFFLKPGMKVFLENFHIWFKEKPRISKVH
jgi:hypothetical protein